MADFASLFHHLVDHAPGLSETNRQEYHDMIDEAAKENQDAQAPEPEEPKAPEAPEPEAPAPEAPEG